ncbi:hypothetical protein PQX77_001477, partial [Marasmius sp. AFHP31]
TYTDIYDREKPRLGSSLTYAMARPFGPETLFNKAELGIVSQESLKYRGYSTETIRTKAFADDGPLMEQFFYNNDTPPYMRVMQTYVRMHVEYKKYAAAVYVAIITAYFSFSHHSSRDAVVDNIRLSRSDPMEQCTWLDSLLCFTKRYADALHFAQTFMNVPTCTGRLPYEDLPPGGGTKLFPPRNVLYTAEEQSKLEEHETTIFYGSLG